MIVYVLFLWAMSAQVLAQPDSNHGDVDHAVVETHATSVERVDDPDLNETVGLATLDSVLPQLPTPQPARPWTLLLVAVLAWLGAAIQPRLRRTLSHEGLLPQLVGWGGILCRMVFLVAVVGLAVTVLPVEIQPLLPWVLLAVALAFGWSTRQMLTDVMCGFVLRVNNTMQTGLWVEGREFQGVISHRGLLATTIQTPDGESMRLPNRVLLNTPTTVDLSGRPFIEVGLELPIADEQRLRTLITQAVLGTPWVATQPDLELIQDGEHPHRWCVRVRVLSPEYFGRIRGMLRQRVMAELRSSDVAQ